MPGSGAGLWSRLGRRPQDTVGARGTAGLARIAAPSRPPSLEAPTKPEPTRRRSGLALGRRGYSGSGPKSAPQILNCKAKWQCGRTAPGPGPLPSRGRGRAWDAYSQDTGGDFSRRNNAGFVVLEQNSEGYVHMLTHPLGAVQPSSGRAPGTVGRFCFALPLPGAQVPHAKAKVVGRVLS